VRDGKGSAVGDDENGGRACAGGLVRRTGRTPDGRRWHKVACSLCGWESEWRARDSFALADWMTHIDGWALTRVLPLGSGCDCDCG
jgi:hypothetical protein